MPHILLFDTAMLFMQRRVVLVTLNAERRALELRTETGGK